MNHLKHIAFVLSLVALIWIVPGASASAAFTLRDYADARRVNDVQKIKELRTYILGAVDTHLLYAKMLRDWTSINILCTGNYGLNVDELGSVFELKIMTLRKRYGEEIMDMPILNAVQMIVEEHYRCY